MIVPQTITYRTVDGLDLTYDLYLPQRAAKSSNGYPLVIWFHGGGLLQGSKINLPTHFKQLAEQEHDEPIAVLTPDYRLAPQVSLPDILEDIDALLAHVRSDAFTQNGIDVDRIALSGGSAGGYLALIAGLTTSSTEGSESYSGNNGQSGIKCLAPYYPITNLVDPFWTRKQSCPSWLKSPVTDEQAMAFLNPSDPPSASSAPGSARSCLYAYMLQHGLLASLLFPNKPSQADASKRYGFDDSIPSQASLFSIPQRLAATSSQQVPVYITYGTHDDAVNPFEETVAALRSTGGIVQVEVEHGLGHAYDEDEQWWGRAGGLRRFLAEQL